MQYALLKALSPENAAMRFRQGKLTRFDYALYRYLSDEQAVRRFKGSDMVRLRQDLHLTQEALGDLLAVTKRTVLRWENEQDPIPGSVNIALNALMVLKESFFTLMDPMAEGLVPNGNVPVAMPNEPSGTVDDTDFDTNAVVELRERLRMTRREFAAFLQVSTSTVDKWETGTVTPKGPALALLKILRRDGLGVMP